MAGKSDIVRGALDALTDVYKKTFAPETYYHATLRSDIEKFDPNASPSLEREGKTPRGASYFTTNPEYADEILSYHTHNAAIKKFGEYQADSTVYPVKLKLDSVFDQDNPEHINKFKESYRKVLDDEDPRQEMLNWLNRQSAERERQHLAEWDILELPAVQEALKDAGFRGYKTNEKGTVGLFYPDKGDVRSVFAKFDPTKSKSGNILASVPAGALATGALGNLVEEE